MKSPDSTLKSAEKAAADETLNAVEGDAVFAFAGFTLDTTRNVLCRDGVEVPLRPKSLALLKYLVQRHGETIPKRILAAAIWPVQPSDVDASVAQCIKDIRAVLGSDARGMLQTVPGIGYAFRGQVEKREVRPSLTKNMDIVSRRIRWQVGVILAGLTVAGSVAVVAYLVFWLGKEPENDPFALQESYRYRPERSILNTETVTIKTDDGKTIICRGGNMTTRTARKCWWGTP